MLSILYADCHICWLSLMLSFTYKSFMLSVIMLSVMAAKKAPNPKSAMTFSKTTLIRTTFSIMIVMIFCSMKFDRITIDRSLHGARYLTGENQEVVWDEISTLSWAVSFQSNETARPNKQSLLELKTRPRFHPVSWSLLMNSISTQNRAQRYKTYNGRNLRVYAIS
jgi:hypothetical protein